MITLITGVPGSGKSLYAVSELLLPMQGATVEHEGDKVPRILHTNIKNLLLDHTVINAENLNTWHEWCKPGDLICYDEVQEVWRPRAMGASAPAAIAALEIHRHKAVDFVLITQHPMLLDQNIRRLVGRHLHVRRVANMALAVVYEWDHASNPSMVRSAITSRPWRYPKSAYKLYKSAEAHTKQPRRLPAALIVLGLALAGMAYGIPTVFGRLDERFNGSATQLAAKANKDAKAKPSPSASPPAPTTHAAASGPISPPQVIGCITSTVRCSCYGIDGQQVDFVNDVQCRVVSNKLQIAPLRYAAAQTPPT
jgi:zona occludens toxin